MVNSITILFSSSFVLLLVKATLNQNLIRTVLIRVSKLHGKPVLIQPSLVLGHGLANATNSRIVTHALGIQRKGDTVGLELTCRLGILCCDQAHAIFWLLLNDPGRRIDQKMREKVRDTVQYRS